MLNLYLECSSLKTGFLLAKDHEVLATDNIERHGDVLLVERLPQALAQHGYAIHDIKTIIWGQGPGSFTGIRICATWIQAIAYVNHCTVYPVCSFRARLWTYLSLLDQRPTGLIEAHFKANQAMNYVGAWAVNDTGIHLHTPITVMRRDDTSDTSIDLSLTYPTPEALVALHQQDQMANEAAATPVTAIYPQYIFDHFKTSN
jgi:tRNA threonylcarbamoyl adenosine modification protein YeaZ